MAGSVGSKSLYKYFLKYKYINRLNYKASFIIYAFLGIMQNFFFSHPCLRKQVRYDTPIVLHVKLCLLLLNLVQQVPVGLTAISLIITGHLKWSRALWQYEPHLGVRGDTSTVSAASARVGGSEVALAPPRETSSWAS